MDFLILIKNGCDNLTATVVPLRGLAWVCAWCLALATIMLVWFGVQEALASAQGGPGFSIAKFLNFFLLITFAYCFVKFYDGSIPGIGYSLKGFVSGGTQQPGRLHRQRFDARGPEHNTHSPQQGRKTLAFVHRTLYASLHIYRSGHPQHS